MKTGKHYFGLLTEEEQRNFRQACADGACYAPFSIIMKKQYENFAHFINDIDWFKSSQGYQYWSHIEVSTRTERPKQPLATFRLTLIYIAIVSTFLGLLWLVYHTGHQQGYKSGYRNGIEKVDSLKILIR